MLFRISTEFIHPEGVEKLAGKYFPGFTVYQAFGFWNGIKEKSLILEVEGEAGKLPEIKKLAGEIKEANKQEAVLIQVLENNSLLV